MPKKLSEEEKKAREFNKLCKDLIPRFIKYPNNKAIWPREMKLAKQLCSICAEREFWMNLELGFELNSLAWFLTKDGKAFLKKKYNQYKFKIPEKTKEYKIEEKKSFKVDNSKRKKIKTLDEFLRNGESKK